MDPLKHKSIPLDIPLCGVDETSYFGVDRYLLDSKTKQSVPKDRYKCRPRPLPQCLDILRRATESTTGEKFNFCLVNYYASGNDGISYHNDDERFLGSNPAIASFSLGRKRDFVLKRKPVPSSMFEPVTPETKPLKLPLASGDMILMWVPLRPIGCTASLSRKVGRAERAVST